MRFALCLFGWHIICELYHLMRNRDLALHYIPALTFEIVLVEMTHSAKIHNHTYLTVRFLPSLDTVDLKPIVQIIRSVFGYIVRILSILING